MLIIFCLDSWYRLNTWERSNYMYMKCNDRCNNFVATLHHLRYSEQRNPDWVCAWRQHDSTTWIQSASRFRSSLWRRERTWECAAFERWSTSTTQRWCLPRCEGVRTASDSDRTLSCRCPATSSGDGSWRTKNHNNIRTEIVMQNSCNLLVSTAHASVRELAVDLVVMTTRRHWEFGKGLLCFSCAKQRHHY